jgi:hypothetical protein
LSSITSGLWPSDPSVSLGSDRRREGDHRRRRRGRDRLGVAVGLRPLIDDPAVAAAARKDFVARAELEAEKAKNAELVRQLNAGAAAIEEARKQADADAIAAEETARRTEVEIVAYEKRLAAAGRSCRIDPADLDFLLKP